MADVTSRFEEARVVAHGNLVGIATASSMTSQLCSFTKFVADEGNTGVVCIGNSSGVTVSANATNATAGLQLTAKGDSGWIPCTNLNDFYYICSSTVDHVSYMCIG